MMMMMMMMMVMVMMMMMMMMMIVTKLVCDPLWPVSKWLTRGFALCKQTRASVSSVCTCSAPLWWFPAETS